MNSLRVVILIMCSWVTQGAAYSYDISSRCHYLPDGMYPLGPCSQLFLACSGRGGTITKCPSELYFDPDTAKCERKELIPSCGGSTSTTPMSDITATTKPSTFDCMGFYPGDYPLRPNACVQQYFTCDADGVGFIRQCPNNLFFDPDKRVCNFYDNVPACAGTTTQPLTRTTTSPQPTLPPVDFDCTLQPDGYYPNPRNPCSNLYYVCVDGDARELHCEQGLVYDVVSQACQSPENTYACTGRTSTATTQTTGATTPALPIDCTFLPNGLYVDPLKECSRIFYSCSDGIAEKFYCPSDLYFDPLTKKCQRFDEIFACTGRTPTTTTPTPSTETSPISDIPFDCTGRPNGDYANPAQPCSTFYYVCSGSVTTVQDCPRGLYFDPEKTECDSFGNIFVCTGTRSTVTPTTTSVTQSTSSPDVNCAQLGNGLFPDPRSPCSQTYYYCSNGFAYRRQCQDDLYFNPELRICDHFNDIYECTGTRSTVSTTGTSTATPLTSIAPFDCSFLPNGDYPDPRLPCSHLYYTCSNGKATQRTCPADTYFDAEMEECMEFDNVPACSGKTRTTRATSTTTPMSDFTTPFYNCAQKPNDNYPLGPCEKTYVSCVDGEPILRYCPMNLYYDYTINECDYIYNVPSCGGERTTTPMSDVTSSPTTPHPDFDCTHLPDGKYPNPNSQCFSHFYYVCTGGQTIKMYCPASLVYDPYLSECRYLKNACHWRPPYYNRVRRSRSLLLPKHR